METAYQPQREYLSLSSSMPHLRRDADPPLSTDTFLSQCSTVLETGDYAFLAQLDFGAANQIEAIKGPLHGYFQWEIALRNAIGSYRHAHPLPMDRRHEQGHMKEFVLLGNGVGSDVEHLLHECRTLDPLQAEQRLHGARWQRLEFAREGNQFNLAFLSVYRLQLLLLETRQKWQQEAGELSYNRICQTIFARSKGSLG